MATEPVAGRGSAEDEVVRRALDEADRQARTAREAVVETDFRAYWGAEDARLVFSIDPARGELQFREVDFATGEVRDAFDHAAFATALARASGRECDPRSLPIQDLEPEPGGGICFRAFDRMWQWNATAGTIVASERPPREIQLLAPDAPISADVENHPCGVAVVNDSDGEIELFWRPSQGERRSYGRVPAGDSRTVSTFSGHAWLLVAADGAETAKFVAPRGGGRANYRGPLAANGPQIRHGLSPDGRWLARVQDRDVFLRPATGGAEQRLTRDGTAALGYDGRIQWAPDSRHFVASHRHEPGERLIHIVQAAPQDQLHPKLVSLRYAKPGDDRSYAKPHLFALDGSGAERVAVDDALFGTPWNIDHLAWDADSSGFSFLYNQRGHQVMRLIRVASSGEVRILHEEASPTFIDHSQKTWLRRLANGRGILWATEASGHNHIILIDAEKGGHPRPITRGPWNVRRVAEVDEHESGLIEMLVETIGMDAENPYHNHFARLTIPPSGEVRMVRLTDGPAHFRLNASPTGRWLLAIGSRPDSPPVVECREAATGLVKAVLSKGDDARARANGWHRPERFVAKGRDGRTAIHGLIHRPHGFDPAKSYPVVENIYAGPHGFFVPQVYGDQGNSQVMANLGFVVVQIDGMGTNWRSKAFHDVAWQNLKDSGFPDRIEWIRAAAAERPWMDLARVGIYGGSAGGQSALAALLHHGDFYHVAVADSGCHDNRMDKACWNEAWMGWPIGNHYADNSNVTHAANLRGRLMLIVGEIEPNVDPASSAQVAAALQRAGKSFDYVPIMNAGHGAAESSYGRFRRAAFLLDHLQP